MSSLMSNSSFSLPSLMPKEQSLIFSPYNSSRPPAGIWSPFRRHLRELLDLRRIRNPRTCALSSPRQTTAFPITRGAARSDRSTRDPARRAGKARADAVQAL